MPKLKRKKLGKTPSPSVCCIVLFLHAEGRKTFLCKTAYTYITSMWRKINSFKPCFLRQNVSPAKKWILRVCSIDVLFNLKAALNSKVNKSRKKNVQLNLTILIEEISMKISEYTKKYSHGQWELKTACSPLFLIFFLWLVYFN